MSTYTELTDKATAQLFGAVKPVEDLAVTFATAVDGMTDKLRGLPLQEQLPTASELVTAHFALVERLVSAQKDLAVRLTSSAPTLSVVPAQAAQPRTAAPTTV